MDLYILFLPITTVWNLQMSLGRKIAVLSVMTCGICSVTIACIRIPIIVSLVSSPDTSYEVGIMIIIAAIEAQSAIVAVNLPAIKSLWGRLRAARATGGRSDVQHNPVQLRFLGKGPRSGKNPESKPMGTITRLERGITSTESEEELFQYQTCQGETPKSHSDGHSMKRHELGGSSIRVKRDVHIISESSEEGSRLPKHRLINMYTNV